MTILDAVEQVLNEAAIPLHHNDITAKIIAKKLWQPSGKTPGASIHARLAVDIKALGNHSRFIRTAPGIFALRVWENDDNQTSYESTAVAITAQNISNEGIPSGSMTFCDAAEAILNTATDHFPMHYKTIAAQAIQLGILVSSGKTPEATLYAQVLTEIGRREKRGEPQRFVKYGKGYIGLAEWEDNDLAFQIDQHNRTVKKKLHESLLSISPSRFEGLIGALLVKIGFDDVIVTKTSGDGGIDVRGTLVVGDVIRTRMAVQVKRWKNNIQAPTVQQVRGSLGAHEQGLIITTSDFSIGARKEASQSDKTPVALMNGEQLVSLLIENELGIRSEQKRLIELLKDGDDVAVE